MDKKLNYFRTYQYSKHKIQQYNTAYISQNTQGFQYHGTRNGNLPKLRWIFVASTHPTCLPLATILGVVPVCGLPQRDGQRRQRLWPTDRLRLSCQSVQQHAGGLGGTTWPAEHGGRRYRRG